MCSTIIKQYPCYIVAGYTFGSLSQFYTWWQTSLNLVWSKPLISLGLTVVLRFSGKLFCQIIECYVIYIQFFSKCSVLNNNELCLLLFHTRKLYARTLLHYTVMHLHSPNQQSKIQFFIFWLLSFKSLQFLFRITLINKFVFMVTWIESQCAKKTNGRPFFLISSVYCNLSSDWVRVFWHLWGIWWTIPVLSTIYDLIQTKIMYNGNEK